MSRLTLVHSLIWTGLISSLIAVNAYAATYVEIVTPVPPPKEELVVPPGYATCFNVPSTWYNGVWYPEHRVCQYDPNKRQAAEGDAYVEAHWACTKYSVQQENKGACVNWSWQKGHWIKTFTPF